VRPDDQPEDGGVRKLVTVRQVEPRVDFEEDPDDPDACGRARQMLPDRRVIDTPFQPSFLELNGIL